MSDDKRPCACGKKNCGLEIRQERLAPKHWRVHQHYECYEKKDDCIVRRWQRIENKNEN